MIFQLLSAGREQTRQTKQQQQLLSIRTSVYAPPYVFSARCKLHVHGSRYMMCCSLALEIAGARHVNHLSSAGDRTRYPLLIVPDPISQQ